MNTMCNKEVFSLQLILQSYIILFLASCSLQPVSCAILILRLPPVWCYLQMYLLFTLQHCSWIDFYIEDEDEEDHDGEAVDIRVEQRQEESRDITSTNLAPFSDNNISISLLIKTSARSEEHISNTERQGIDVSKPHECGLICSKSTHTGFQQGAAISEEDSRVDCNLSCGGQELLECTHQQHNPIKNRSVDKVAHVTTNNESKLGPDSCYNNIKIGSVDLEHDFEEMDCGEMSPIVDEAQRGPQASHGTLPRATEKKQTESEIVPMIYINSQLASPEGDSSVHDESGHSECENSIIHRMKAENSDIEYEEIEAMPVAAKYEDVQALPVAAKDKSKAHFRIQSVAKKRNSEKRDSEIKYEEIEAMPVAAKYEDVQALPVAAKDKSKVHFRIHSVAKKRNSEKRDSEIKYEEVEAMPVAAKYEDVQALPVAAKDKSKAHFRIQSVAKKRNSEKRDSEIKYEEIEAMPVAAQYEDDQALPVAAKDKSKVHFRIQSVAKNRNSEKQDSEMKVPISCRQSTSDQISLNSNSNQEYQNHALNTAISAAEYEDVDTLPVPTKDLVTADLRLSHDGRKQMVTGVAKGPTPTTKFKPLTAKQKKSKFGVDDGETYKNTSLKSISASIQSGEYGSLHQRSHSTSPTSVRKVQMHTQSSFSPERVSPTSRLPGRTDFSRIDTPDNLLRKNIEPWDSLRAKSVGPSSPVESHVNRSQPWLSVRPMMAIRSDGGVMVSSSVPDLSHEYVDEDYINTSLTVIESRHNNALAIAYRNTSGGGASSASPEYVDEDYINTALSALTDVTSPTADSHDKQYINAPQLSSFPTSKEKEDDFEYDYPDLRNTRIVIPPCRLTKVTTLPASRRDDKEFHYPLKWNTDKTSMIRRDLQFDKNESESWKTQSFDAATWEESAVSQDDPDYILGYVKTDCKRQLPCTRSKSNIPQPRPFNVGDDLDYDYPDLHRSIAFNLLKARRKGQELTKPPPRKRTMKKNSPSYSAESFTAKSLPSWWLQLTAQRMAPQERDRSSSEVVETQAGQQLPPRNILRTMSQRRQSISLGKNRKQSRVTGAESDYYITIAPAQCTIDDNYINWEMIYSGNKQFSQVVSGEREEVVPPRNILRSGGGPNRVYSVDDMDILYVNTPPLQPLKLEPSKLPQKLEPKLPPKPEPIVPPKPVPKPPPKQQPNLSMKPLPKLPMKPELGKSSQERTDSGLVNQSYSENQAKPMPTRMLKPPTKEAKEVNPSDVKQLASAPQNLKPVAVLEHFI